MADPSQDLLLSQILEGHLSSLTEDQLYRFDRNYLQQLYSQNPSSYCDAAELVIASVDIQLLQREQLDLFCKRFLLHAPHPKVLLSVARALQEERETCFRQEKLLSLLIRLLRNRRWMVELIVCCCQLVDQNQSNSALEQFTAIQSQLDEQLLRSLETLLVNLPVITANQFQFLNDPFFRSNNYFSLLASILFHVLKQIKDNLKDGQDQKLSFVSSLIGRLCTNRQDKPIFSNCLKPFLHECEQDYVARRVVARLFFQVKDSQLEVLIHRSLIECDTIEELIWCFGEQISRPRVGYLLNSKLLTSLPPLPWDSYVRNLVGYLAHTKKHFVEGFCNGLELWCNASIVKRLTDDHHFYLCTLLATFLYHLKTGNYEMDVDKISLKCMHGVETHLHRVERSKSNSGLFIGQNLCNFLMKGKIDPINFKVPIDDEKVQDLKNILECGKSSKKAKTKADIVPQILPKKLNNIPNSESTIDEDDDDLQPMDMSHDIPIEQQKRPFYLRDCLQGLTNNEDPDWQMRCLQECESMMLVSKLQTKELSVELARALLRMSIDKEEFLPYRIQCLIRLGAMVPDRVATFLVDQFYDENVPICEKLDVLTIINGSVKELSALPIEADSEKNPRSALNSLRQISEVKGVEKLDQDWQSIVQQRIQSKTRILASASHSSIGRENKLAKVVHYFFFPLLNRYNKDVTLRLNEEDYSVLSQMFYTLAQLIRAVNQLHVTRNMFIPLFKFIQHFRNHTERSVRQAIVHCINVIVLSVPSHYLYDEFSEQTIELRNYLETLKHLDPQTFSEGGFFVLYTLDRNIRRLVGQ